MKKFLLSVAFIGSVLVGTAQTWKLDPAHSQLGFRIGHMGISEIAGDFRKTEASIVASKADFSDAQIDLTAYVSSINTGVEQRDSHLKADDFFDAEKYPTITFKSTSLKPTGKNKYKLTGNLTLHGVTKQITLDLEHGGTITHPQSKKEVAGFKVTGTIKRTDFQFASKYPAPILSDEIQIIASGEFGKE